MMDDTLRAKLRHRRLPEDADGLMHWLVTHRITPQVERYPNGEWGVRSDMSAAHRGVHRRRSLREALAHLALAVAARRNGQNG